MHQRALSILVFVILSLETAACVFQWELWPLSGHSLYAEKLDYRRLYLHRFRATFADGRVEEGVFPEMRSPEGGGAELAAWCSRLRARTGFSGIVGTRSRFVSLPGGGVEMEHDEPENLCGG